MKTRLMAGSALGVLFALTAFAGVGADGDAKKLQGTWQATAAKFEGKKLPDEALEKIEMRVTFAGDKYKVVVQGKQVEAGTFKVAGGKTIDLTITEGKQKGRTQLGLYKIDGETLTVALPPDGSEKERPKDFESTAENRAEVTTLKRQGKSDDKK